MNIFRALTVSSKAETKTQREYELLPELHSFVDIELGANRPIQSTSIDAIDGHTITTRPLPGLSAGRTVRFSYSNTYGRYRFSTVCASVDTQRASFDIPPTITTIVKFGSKRASLRVASMLPIDWRFTVSGRGSGDFLKGSIMDLSRSGASLIVNPELKIASELEIRFKLNTSAAPLTVLGEVVRATKIQASKKIAAGVRFMNVASATEQAIIDFVNERQKLRRQRGVV